MMNIGKRIYELRSKSGMSQGDLADKLDVSRQTISKWENGMCMPETEKLIQLSNIFSVSTDFILKGEEKTSEPVYVYVKSKENNPSAYNEQIVRKYIGIVLAVVFTLVAVVLLLMGGSFMAILPGAVVLLGILFAKNAKHPWLITFWAFYVCVLAIAPFVSSISLLMIFDPIIYTKGYELHFAWGWGLWLVLTSLVLATLKAKKSKKENKIKALQ